MSNGSWRFNHYGDLAPEAGKPKGRLRTLEGHTTIDLLGVARIPLDCWLTMKQCEGSLTADQGRRCDQAIADACSEMLRRKLAKMRG